MTKTSKNGFTLIELLVVIAIISLLSSTVIASLSTARGKGYDAKFIEEMSSLRTGLSLYRSSHGTFPLPIASRSDAFSTDYDTSLAPLVADKIISSIPHYFGWNVGGTGFTASNYVYSTYNPAVSTNGSYTTEFTCGTSTVDYATWTPGSLPGTFIFINDTGHFFNLPTSYTRCTNDPAGPPGCYAYTGYYCMQLFY